MFYDNYERLCQAKGVTPSKAATDNGISKTSVTRWKDGATPNAKYIYKLAAYFDVSADEILGVDIKNPATENSDGLSGKRLDLYNLMINLPPELEDQVTTYLQGLIDGHKHR